MTACYIVCLSASSLKKTLRNELIHTRSHLWSNFKCRCLMNVMGKRFWLLFIVSWKSEHGKWPFCNTCNQLTHRENQQITKSRSWHEMIFHNEQIPKMKSYKMSKWPVNRNQFKTSKSNNVNTIFYNRPISCSKNNKKAQHNIYILSNCLLLRAFGKFRKKAGR